MTKKINRSPDKDLTPTPTGNTDYFDYLLDEEKQKMEREQNPKWQKNNLEYDLRTTDWIIQKVKNDDVYAQNLYAALCNNQFIQLEDIWNILKENYWHCSWRYAGGIIADIQEQGDYIDWYCSGMGDKKGNRIGYVGEGFVSPDVKADLKQLGWVIIPNNDDV